MTIFDRIEIIRILINVLDDQWNANDWNMLKSIANYQYVDQTKIPQLNTEGEALK